MVSENTLRCYVRVFLATLRIGNAYFIARTNYVVEGNLVVFQFLS